jgi:DNA mismatch repair protein MLH3
MSTSSPRPASGRITPLSRPASTTLRSSLLIPTYPSVLQELLHNSLDADARSIRIWVDATPGDERIWVEDDGHGIRAGDLSRIGRRYESSKELSGSGMGSTCSYGFRGEGEALIPFTAWAGRS